MYQYPKIADESILLDKDCKRLLKRNSRKSIIDEVLNKFNNKEQANNNNNKENTSLKEDVNSNNNIFNLYSFILTIFNCNKSI